MSSPWLLAMALVVVLAGVLAGRPRPRRWLAGLWHHWRHHLPSGELARAMVPAA